MALAWLLATLIVGNCAAFSLPGVHAIRLKPLASGDAGVNEFNTSISLDLGSKDPISPLLYGIFFEEIGHAGDGGIYAELVQDRSFDAWARAIGFGASSVESQRQRVEVDLASLSEAHRLQAEQQRQERAQGGTRYRSKADYLKSRQQQQQEGIDSSNSNDITLAWQVVGPGVTSLALTREHPLNERNQVALSITSSGIGGPSGIANIGYWGISLRAGESYTASLYLLNTESAGKDVVVSLVSEDGGTLYATATLTNVVGGWRQHSAELLSSAHTTTARLTVTFLGPGTLHVDQVSLFPTENVRRGEQYLNPWPFRQDLLDALKALKPKFLRFPGGCYIEGDWLRNAFFWKNAVGPAEARAGHWNGVWSYWSTDGLGLFEYMLMVEELGAEPIWVINNGISHQQSITGADIMPLVQDALDSLEFIMGPSDSTWGGLRAAMGHPEPWHITYMSIGNEGCGLPWDPPVYKPFYFNNYAIFYGAIKAKYPHMTLIANCDMRDDAPTDLWEYHVYTNPDDMFGRRHVFDGMTPQNSHYIFASEYAVTDGGGQGNLIGAVAEAGFMTGMERNSGIVLAASYAPLFVNIAAKPWPTNLIVFDNHRWYGIPSYYVQQLFAEHQGTHYVHTHVGTASSASASAKGNGPEDRVAASATCQDPECTALSVKIVNMAPFPQDVAVRLQGPRSDCVRQQGRLQFLTSQGPGDENTLDQPTRVSTQLASVHGLSDGFIIPVTAFSVNVLSVNLSGCKGAAGPIQLYTQAASTQ